MASSFEENITRPAVGETEPTDGRVQVMIVLTGELVRVRPERLITDADLRAAAKSIRAECVEDLLEVSACIENGLSGVEQQVRGVWAAAVRLASLAERKVATQAQERTTDLGFDELMIVFTSVSRLTDLTATQAVCTAWRDAARATAETPEWQEGLLIHDILVLAPGAPKRVRWGRDIEISDSALGSSGGCLTTSRDSLGSTFSSSSSVGAKLLGLDKASRRSIVGQWMSQPAHAQVAAQSLTVQELLHVDAPPHVLLRRLDRVPTEGVACVLLPKDIASATMRAALMTREAVLVEAEPNQDGVHVRSPALLSFFTFRFSHVSAIRLHRGFCAHP